jgi:hypothetical protein
MKHAILAVALVLAASFGASAGHAPVSPKPGKIIADSAEQSSPRRQKKRDKPNPVVPPATLQWGDLWK